MDLLVNEIFGPTFQGEGLSQGERVVFLRLAGCNLACLWCDTPYSWNWNHRNREHPQQFDSRQEIHPMSIEVVYKRMLDLGGRKIKRLVISGGEPILQQARLTELTSRLYLKGWQIEVETNATIKPLHIFGQTIAQFNCSPKLRNAGRDNPEWLRLVPDALKFFASCSKANFKFVIESWLDAKEAADLVEEYRIPKERVFFMSQACTQEEHARLGPEIIRMAQAHMVRYTSRRHIELYGRKRGV